MYAGLVIERLSVSGIAQHNDSTGIPRPLDRTQQVVATGMLEMPVYEHNIRPYAFDNALKVILTMDGTGNRHVASRTQPELNPQSGLNIVDDKKYSHAPLNGSPINEEEPVGWMPRLTDSPTYPVKKPFVILRYVPTPLVSRSSDKQLLTYIPVQGRADAR